MATKLIVLLVATVAAIAASADSNNTSGVCESTCFSDDTYLAWCGHYYFDCPVNQTCTGFTYELSSRCYYYTCEDPLPMCELDSACRNEARFFCQCPDDSPCETKDPEDANPVWRCAVATTTDTVATAMP